MSLDSILMILADRKVLRSVSKKRTISVPSLQASNMTKDGMAKGRAEDGTPIRARIGGKSLARRLMEEEETRKLETSWQKRSRKRADRRKQRAKKKRFDTREGVNTEIELDSQ